MELDNATEVRATKIELPVAVSAIPYRTDIDGLRGIAVVAVVLFHAWPSSLRGGFVGVDVFFVISGYLISGIIFSELKSSMSFGFTDFYFRRARRLFPALIIVLAFSVCLGWLVSLPKQYAQVGTHVAAAATFVTNFIFFREVGYFDTNAEAKTLLHLWSLGVEEQFYLIWPAVLVLISRLPRLTKTIIIILAIASFTQNIETSFSNRSAAFFLPQTRFWELLVGALIALKTQTKNSLLSRQLADIASIAAIVLLLAAVFTIKQNRIFPGWWALLPVAASALFISAGPNAIFNRTVLSARPVVLIGLISYPLYLWHWVLLSFVHIVDIDKPSFFTRTIAVILAILLAWMTYRYIERPIRFGTSQKFWSIVLIVTLGAVGTVGFLIGVNRGFPNRTIYGWAEQRRFVQFYRDGLETAVTTEWKDECNFYDWRNRKSKDFIPSTCTATPNGPVLFLWGDSHAESLSQGIREALDGKGSFTQIASSDCGPSLSDVNKSLDIKSCNRSNQAARNFIRISSPDVLILAQNEKHEQTDWTEIASYALRSGVKKVILIGPTPHWKPSLPEIISRHFWRADHSVIQEGVDTSALRTDRDLIRKYGYSNLLYISLIDKLCFPNGCRTIVPGEKDNGLIVFDYGHLTPEGSRFVGQTILKSILLKAIQ